MIHGYVFVAAPHVGAISPHLINPTQIPLTTLINTLSSRTLLVPHHRTIRKHYLTTHLTSAIPPRSRTDGLPHPADKHRTARLKFTPMV